MLTISNSYGTPVSPRHPARRYEEERLACIRHLQRLVDRETAHLNERLDWISLDEEMDRRSRIARYQLVLDQVRLIPS